MTFDSKTYRLSGAEGPGRIAGIVGLICLALSAVGYFMAGGDGHAAPAAAGAHHGSNPGQFFQSYLNAFTFWVTLGLGGLFATVVHHLVRATWSVVMRRMYEAMMMTLPILAIFFLPIAIGGMDLYHWSNDAGELLDKKRAWLNPEFFYIRAGVYFAIWFVLGRLLYRASLQQDEDGSEALNIRMRRISAPGLILFALTTTFAAFDWLMSLNYHWFSTIFGIYVFAGAYLSCTAFTVLVTMYLRKHKVMTEQITEEHYHDMGKWMFAFVVFWSYIAFSQFFLIWYANLPEETIFFKARSGEWLPVSIALGVVHFVIPFFFLLSSLPKRKPIMLVIAGAWILAVHWFDHFWLIAPNFQVGGFHFHWLDVTCWLGIGGIFFWYFWRKYTSNALVPLSDPRLDASVKFANFWV